MLHPKKQVKYSINNVINNSNGAKSQQKTQKLLQEESKNFEAAPHGLTPEFKSSLEQVKQLNDSETFKQFVKIEEITFVIFVQSEAKSSDLLKFVTTSSDGFIKMNEVDLKNNKFVCKKSLFVCQSGISTACQLSGEQSFALAGMNNSIYIFSFQTGTCINEFQAHDDFISCILFHDAKLVSCSMDQSIKIWDLKQQYYEDDPVTIYDHDDEVICADIRASDSLLASMDIKGVIYIRRISNLSEAETVLYTINSIPKDMDTFAKVLFNYAKPGDEKEVLVILND